MSLVQRLAQKKSHRRISESIYNQWMGMGPKVKEFEEKFKIQT